MPSTFLVVSFSVLVVNESVIVIGLYKVIKGSGQSSILQLSFLCNCSIFRLSSLIQDDVNDNLVGNLFRLKYFLACWCRCRKSKSVQFTSDANQFFCTSRASMSSVNELVNLTSSAFIINSAVQGQQRTVDKLAIKLSQSVI